MKKIIVLALAVLSVSYSVHAENSFLKGVVNNLKTNKNATALTQTKLSDTKIGQGLKEALKVGITNAVQSTGKPDGFLKNEAIKILMPDQLKTLEKGLRTVGMGNKVDEFVLSMNRAAEKAAPQAQEIFLNALFDMSFADVQKLYQGGPTAATDYFKKMTHDKLYKAFSPSVKNALNEYQVTGKYKDIIDKYRKIPFSQNLPAPDIDDYVVSKSLDGLYAVLSQEEQKIRTDPKAQVTGLLKEVFGK